MHGEGPSGVTWAVCGVCDRPVPFSSPFPGPWRCAGAAQCSQHRLQRRLRGRQGTPGAAVWGRPCPGSASPELGAPVRREQPGKALAALVCAGGGMGGAGISQFLTPVSVTLTIPAIFGCFW